MDFGDLDDKEIQTKLKNFSLSVQKIEVLLNNVLNSAVYEKLTVKEKVDYDLFLAYALNTLFWLHLRTKGEDPNASEVKNQLARVKEYMLKAKQANDRAFRPKVDQKAAERFVRHGTRMHDTSQRTEHPPNKKARLN